MLVGFPLTRVREKLQNFAYMIYHVGIWFKYDWLDSNSYINKIKTNTCYFYTLWVVFCQKLINLQCFCKILSLRFMLFSPQKKLAWKAETVNFFAFWMYFYISYHPPLAIGWTTLSGMAKVWNICMEPAMPESIPWKDFPF